MSRCAQLAEGILRKWFDIFLRGIAEIIFKDRHGAPIILKQSSVHSIIVMEIDGRLPVWLHRTNYNNHPLVGPSIQEKMASSDLIFGPVSRQPQCLMFLSSPWCRFSGVY